MLNLPEHGDRVRVYPMPGRQAQLDERPVDRLGGGRLMPKSGATVIWSPFHHAQLLQGALLLHPPPCDGDKHDHGPRGDDDCAHCGRTPEEAQQHDVDRAKGIEAAKAATLPKHPLELGMHPQSKAMKAHRANEAKAEADAKAKAEASTIEPLPSIVADAPKPAPTATLDASEK